MEGRTIRRLTGWAAVGMVVFWAAQFPLHLVNEQSVGIYDGAGGAAEAYRIRNVIFTRILLDLGLYVPAMIFADGLGHLISRANPDYGWAGSLVLASMAVWVGVTLVANGLEGGLALDAMAPDPDPSVNRALTMGYILIYNSSIAFAITCLFLGAAGWAAAATGVLPRWTRWVAYVGVLLCAAAVPSTYGEVWRAAGPGRFLQRRRLGPGDHRQPPADALGGDRGGAAAGTPACRGAGRKDRQTVTVPVAYASRRGSTREVAEPVAARLREHGPRWMSSHGAEPPAMGGTTRWASAARPTCGPARTVSRSLTGHVGICSVAATGRP